tara:strand:+ start:2704 stop:2901 length:198 start_codon:yes stop_codon:yes gene_type:complete
MQLETMSCGCNEAAKEWNKRGFMILPIDPELKKQIKKQEAKTICSTTLINSLTQQRKKRQSCATK